MREAWFPSTETNGSKVFTVAVSQQGGARIACGLSCREGAGVGAFAQT